MIKHFIHRIIQTRVFRGVPAELDKVQKRFDAAEAWLIRNAAPLALLIITVGVVFRIYYAAACYLNPDEAIHVRLAQAGGLKQAYLQSLYHAHPPLLPLVLYFFLKLGSSELILRIPSLIAATLGAWFGFRWADRIFGPGVAIGMLALLTFSPAMMLPAVEVRQYGLLIMGVCGVLYGLERAFDERSCWWMAFGCVFLYSAILSHYSALLITIALGCYGSIRLYQERAGLRLWITWIGFQTGAAFLYLVLYLTHIKSLQTGGLQDQAVNSYLKRGYFHGGNESLPEFLWSGLQAVFRYMTGNHLAGFIGVALFIGGAAALLVIPAKSGGEKRRDLSLLLVLPLVLGCAGALMHLLPLIGSRHITYLFPFLAAGISFSVLRWVKHSTLMAALTAVMGLAWLICNISGPRFSPNNAPDKLPLQEMTKALEFLTDEVSADRPLLVDHQTDAELKYYLGDNERRLEVTYSWVFDRESFKSLVEKARDSQSVNQGELLWTMSVGWPRRPPLTKIVPGEWQVRSRQFGQISLLQFKVPSASPEME